MEIKCDICGGTIEIISGGKGKCSLCGLIYSSERLKEIIQTNQNAFSRSTEPEIQIGDKMTFGKYFQNNFIVQEPIEWQVVDIIDNKALIISKFCLDSKQYNYAPGDTTWQTCSLRFWLNETFYNTAFTKDEQDQIINTEIINSNNPTFNTDGGNNTNDKIFLLSIDEVKKYFPTDEERKCIPTQYAFTQGKGVGSFWWLRTPGGSAECAAMVHYAGVVFMNGGGANDNCSAVRPAMWIKCKNNSDNDYNNEDSEIDSHPVSIIDAWFDGDVELYRQNMSDD